MTLLEVTIGAKGIFKLPQESSVLSVWYPYSDPDSHDFLPWISVWSDLRVDLKIDQGADQDPFPGSWTLKWGITIDKMCIFKRQSNKNSVCPHKFQDGVCKNFSKESHKRIFTKSEQSFSAAMIVEITKLFWIF